MPRVAIFQCFSKLYLNANFAYKMVVITNSFIKRHIMVQKRICHEYKCLCLSELKSNFKSDIIINSFYVCMLISIFRRKRRAKRSLASLLTDVSQSCQSWLEGSVFRRSDPITPLQSSSWDELDNSYETNTPISFTYG